MSLNRIGVLLFDGAELLDFAGPLQVFSSFRHLYPEDCDEVITMGLSEEIKVSKLGMTIRPDMTVSKVKGTLDLVVIPGGIGTRSIIKSEAALKNISELFGKTEKLCSVCTGSLILARLGHLKNLKATTHFAALDLLSDLDPSIDVDRSKRYHDHNCVIVSEGVSAGIDMSLYLITKYYGAEKASEVRKYIEYFPE